MNQVNRPTPHNEKPKPGSTLEEALRIIEDYANELREIIKKLRRRLKAPLVACRPP